MGAVNTGPPCWLTRWGRVSNKLEFDVALLRWRCLAHTYRRLLLKCQNALVYSLLNW